MQDRSRRGRRRVPIERPSTTSCSGSKGSSARTPNTLVGMRSRAVLSLGLLAVAALIAGGCLHDEKTTTVTVRETVTETATGTVPNEAPAVLTVFLVDEDEKVAPTARSVVTGPAVARAALNELLVGPE